MSPEKDMIFEDPEDTHAISDFLAVVVLFLLIFFSAVVIFTNKSISLLESRVVKLELEKSSFFFMNKPEPFAALYYNSSFEIKLLDKVATGSKK